jgi:hypothetical protein
MLTMQNIAADLSLLHMQSCKWQGLHYLEVMEIVYVIDDHFNQIVPQLMTGWCLAANELDTFHPHFCFPVYASCTKQ